MRGTKKFNLKGHLQLPSLNEDVKIEVTGC